MGDRVMERAIQTTCLTFVFVQFSSLFGCANQLVQSLCIGGKFVQKIGYLFRIIQQAVTPLFGLMMLTLLFVGNCFHCFQLRLKRVGPNTAHHFANKLHLPTACFTPFVRNTSVEFKRLAQRIFGKLNFLKLLFRQSRKFLAECLKRQHFTFLCTFRQRLPAFIVDQFVILKGAFVIHVRAV